MRYLSGVSDVPAPGTHLGPHLRVVRVLGEGGMGTVLLARDEALERDVAVKLIHPALIGGELGAESFVEEARAMARVRHPNVVQIFAFGEIERGPFFTMEHVDGPSLADHLKTHEALPFDEVVGILKQVAAGVDAIHASGTVHGDLKPSNILLGPGFEARVTDFGLTLHAGRGQAAILGTPHYVAPERIRKDEVPEELLPRSDVYAFGVLAFQLFTGSVPFNAPDAGRIYAQHLYKPRPKVTARRGELPQGLDAVLADAMHRDPAQRTGSAGAVVERIERLRARRRPLRRVLVADDDPDFRAWVRACLETELGIESITEVHDGRTALEALSRGEYDLLVADLHMPRMNGLELTASARHAVESATLRILVVSGHGSASDWRVLSRLGADAFLLKPCGVDDFVSTAGQLLYPERFARGA